MRIDIYKRGQDIQLSTHFHLREAECKCGNCNATMVCREHVTALEAFRVWLDKPIHINSWYRCAGHNFRVGGKPQSLHLIGVATDIVIPGHNIHDYYQECLNRFSGVGKYRSFIHVDSRENEKAIWFGS